MSKTKRIKVLIEVYPTNITVAVYEARERYFKKCNFIEIIS